MSRQTSGRTRKPAENKKTTVAALATFGLIFVAVVVFVIRPTADTASQAEAETDGKVLFETYCAACHGEQGQSGIVPEAPALNADGPAPQLTDAEIAQMMHQGSELMPAMGADFTDEQVAAVTSFIKSLWTPEQRAAQPGQN